MEIKGVVKKQDKHAWCVGDIVYDTVSENLGIIIKTYDEDDDLVFGIMDITPFNPSTYNTDPNDCFHSASTLEILQKDAELGDWKRVKSQLIVELPKDSNLIDPLDIRDE